MSFRIILVGVNGKIICDEEASYPNFPRNGYEKREDGNFYKVMGDPRCISDIETKKEILEQEKEAERARLRSLQAQSRACWGDDEEEEPIMIPFKDIETTFNGLKVLSNDKTNPIKLGNAKVFQAKIKVSVNTYKFYREGGVVEESTRYITLTNVEMYNTFCIPELDNTMSYKRIVLDKYKKTAAFWITSDPIGDPDIILEDALI